jgi:hypothetical protein
MVSANRPIILLLLVGILAQVNSIAVCCVLFTMNRQMIAEKACEKKTRSCCGSCFLKKRIAACSEDRGTPADKTAPNKSNEIHPVQMPGMEPCVNTLPEPGAGSLRRYPADRPALVEGVACRVDHPPSSNASMVPA